MNFSQFLKIASVQFVLLAMLSISGFAYSSIQGWEEGVAAFKSKNYQLAAREFKAYTASNPNSDKGHYMLGLSLEQLKNSKQSLHHLRKAYDLNPNDVSIKLALGRVHVNLGQYKAAFLVLGDGNALHNVHGLSAELGVGLIYNEGVAALYYYGTAALKLGKKKEGLAALKKAAESEPGNKTYQRAYQAAQQ
ncbi:MAG: tetratricopeptide repeat protein [Bacteroidia bacterium]|nr:tetratricopeptide repeat protein [Bacteroidia bacterium]